MAVAIFFSRLDCPLLEPEEARYAEIPRQMLAEGRFITPVLHDEPYYHKPPLFYWLVMVSYSLFGVHDWAARLVPATAALLTVLVSFLWARRTAGPMAAVLGSMILVLCPRYVYMARMLILDGVLCLFVTLALAAAHTSVSHNRFRLRWWLLSAVACGLALLTKGPVSLVLVLTPFCVYLMWDRRIRPSLWAWPAYLATALGVAAPWYVAIALHDPGALRDFFWTHNVQRYVAPFDHVKPFWYYMPDVILGTLPWSILLPGLLLVLLRRGPAIVKRRPPALRFFSVAALCCVAFFSLSGCKRAAYILPAFPPLALALGTFLANTQPWRRIVYPALSCRARWCARPRQLAMTVALMSFVLWSAAAISGLCPLPAALVAIILLPAFALSTLRMQHPLACWANCAASCFALILSVIDVVLPEYHERFALRTDVAAIERITAHEPLPIMCYPKRWDSVSFYLKCDNLLCRRPADLTTDIVLVVKNKNLKDVEAAFGNYEFTVHARNRVCVGVLRKRQKPSTQAISHAAFPAACEIAIED